MKGWFLTGQIDNETSTRKLRVSPLPFIIGRQSGLDLHIHSNNVSRHHAEILEMDGRLILRDLNSTNGSFINHNPVHGDAQLKAGDILHIADVELRLSHETLLTGSGTEDTERNIEGLADNLPVGSVELEEMIAAKRICSYFQTIYSAKEERPFGYEILGRGKHPKLPKAPAKLFKVAEGAGLEIGLVELLRFDGLERAEASGSSLRFFINIHPEELKDPARLLRSLQKVRQAFPNPRLVLEIHEKGVTDLNVMKMLRFRLKAMGIGLAYDDFGAGQARILELAEAPPDYLKFDIALIKNIHRSSARKEMVAMLLQLSKNLKIKTLAEGVSNRQESDTCRALGFDFLQGYYYHRPAAVPQFHLEK